MINRVEFNPSTVSVFSSIQCTVHRYNHYCTWRWHSANCIMRHLAGLQ
jgi:hypothetical protein